MDNHVLLFGYFLCFCRMKTKKFNNCKVRDFYLQYFDKPHMFLQSSRPSEKNANIVNCTLSKSSTLLSQNWAFQLHKLILKRQTNFDGWLFERMLCESNQNRCYRNRCSNYQQQQERYKSFSLIKLCS